MPNPFNYRTHVNQLWRTVNGPKPAYIRLRALDALARDLIPGRPRYAVAQQMLNAVDAYEYADPSISGSEGSFCPPLPLGEGRSEGSPTRAEEQPSEEDDDPL
ncbi:MAG: hypothetical protein OXG42_06760 [Chloroflexi bacterium]|nr:hypothetical protein [Chloroflexota bacterium]